MPGLSLDPALEPVLGQQKVKDSRRLNIVTSVSRAPIPTILPPRRNGHKTRDTDSDGQIRPISLLTLSLLTLLESNFPGESLGDPYGPGNSTPLN